MLAKRLNEPSEEINSRQENETGQLTVEVEEPVMEASVTQDIERVVSSLPKTLKSRAQTLLAYMSPHVMK